jgi:general secretion pathway protein H
MGINTGHMPDSRQKGFSLLEILVVVVIIGIMVSIAAININSADTRPEKNAQRLSALVELAADEAMIHGQEMGLRFYRDSYEFSVLDPGQGIWVRMDNDDMFRLRGLETGLALDLFIEDREIILADSDLGSTDGDDTYEPQIYILSSGEVTPFNVRFRSDFETGGYLLSVTVDGARTITSDAYSDDS